MSRKSKYSFDQKIWAVEQYLNGNRSTVEIAKRLKMPSKSREMQVRRWVHQYQSNRDTLLSNAQYNNHYSKAFKEKVVQEYLAGKMSLPSLANKYGIRSNGTVSE